MCFVFNSAFVGIVCFIYDNKNAKFFQAFKDLGVPYDVYELDKQAEGSKVQDVLDSMTGCRTVSSIPV